MEALKFFNTFDREELFTVQKGVRDGVAVGRYVDFFSQGLHEEEVVECVERQEEEEHKEEFEEDRCVAVGEVCADRTFRTCMLVRTVGKMTTSMLYGMLTSSLLVKSVFIFRMANLPH